MVEAFPEGACKGVRSETIRDTSRTAGWRELPANSSAGVSETGPAHREPMRIGVGSARVCPLQESWRGRALGNCRADHFGLAPVSRPYFLSFR